MVFLSLLFWALLAAYIVHILDETLLNGGFVQWIVDNFWPTYTMRMFFWFNAGAIGAIAPRRPARGRPPRPAGPWQGDCRRVGPGARGQRADRPPRPRRPGHGRCAGLLPARSRGRVGAHRRRPHRPERAHGRRGPGPLPDRRARPRPLPRSGLPCASSSRALPAPFREHAEAAAGAVVRDPAGWDHAEPPPPDHLEVLQRAVIEGVQVEFGYRRPRRRVSSRTVHPLGLVVKNRTWYLVADTDAGQRTFRVSRVRSVEATDRPVDASRRLRPRRKPGGPSSPTSTPSGRRCGCGCGPTSVTARRAALHLREPGRAREEPDRDGLVRWRCAAQSELHAWPASWPGSRTRSRSSHPRRCGNTWPTSARDCCAATADRLRSRTCRPQAGSARCCRSSPRTGRRRRRRRRRRLR